MKVPKTSLFQGLVLFQGPVQHCISKLSTEKSEMPIARTLPVNLHLLELPETGTVDRLTNLPVSRSFSISGHAMSKKLGCSSNGRERGPGAA